MWQKEEAESRQLGKSANDDDGTTRREDREGMMIKTDRFPAKRRRNDKLRTVSDGTGTRGKTRVAHTREGGMTQLSFAVAKRTQSGQRRLSVKSKTETETESEKEGRGE